MQDHRSDTLFGMDGFRVLAVDEYDGVVNVLVELERPDAACPECGTFSAKQRPVVRVADAAAGGRQVVAFWCKRRLRCAEEFCPRASFTQQAPEQVAPRGRLTERLRAVIAKAVRSRPVAEVAGEHNSHHRWTAASSSALSLPAAAPIRSTSAR